MKNCKLGPVRGTDKAPLNGNIPSKSLKQTLRMEIQILKETQAQGTDRMKDGQIPKKRGGMAPPTEAGQIEEGQIQPLAHGKGNGNSEGFELKETKGDLFSCAVDDAMAHCVSQDLEMGKGIAVYFKQGKVSQLRAQSMV